MMKILITLLYMPLLITFFIYYTYAEEEYSEYRNEVKPKEELAGIGRQGDLLDWEQSNQSVLFYPDNITVFDQYDLFYDRIVAISLFGDSFLKNIAIGVLIDKNRVLTSYNPFREMIKDKSVMANVKFTFMSSRKSEEKSANQSSTNEKQTKYYGTYTRDIACARCVIPMEENQVKFEQWHDPERKHSPLHDLLIFKISYPANIGSPGRESVGIDNQDRRIKIIEAGPIVTEIAYSNQHIGKELKLVSLGLTAIEPISVYKTLRYAIYDQSDLIDCYNWLPKILGHFICLKNKPEFIGFASSAMLFSNETLFAVGSFTVFRGAIGVLVFTDVKRYYKLIQNTCTEEDIALLYAVHG